MAAPTWLTDIGFAGKLLQSINKDVNKYGDPKITKTQAITRLFGVNIYPIDPAKSRADNIKVMRNEISRIKARRTQALRDKNLTTEEREKQQMVIVTSGQSLKHEGIRSPSLRMS